MRRIFIVCGLVFALLLMAQAETLAQEIYGCVNNRNGALRIVSNLALCTAKETAITLNQGGTQGPQGPAGQDGLACWDLNGNGVCDVSTEDINLDEKCDALDCKGSIKVYDSSEPRQYLGILLGHSGWTSVSQAYGTPYTAYAEIFIPTLKNSILINKSGMGPYGIGAFPGEPPEIQVYFKDDSCGGTDSIPYLQVFNSHIVCSRGPDGIRYFLTTKGLPQSVGVLSYTFTGTCIQTDIGASYEAIEISQEEIPFKLPVTLPLVYE